MCTTGQKKMRPTREVSTRTTDSRMHTSSSSEVAVCPGTAPVIPWWGGKNMNRTLRGSSSPYVSCTKACTIQQGLETRAHAFPGKPRWLTFFKNNKFEPQRVTHPLAHQICEINDRLHVTAPRPTVEGSHFPPQPTEKDFTDSCVV
jgi:hypothetical protein